MKYGASMIKVKGKDLAERMEKLAGEIGEVIETLDKEPMFSYDVLVLRANIVHGANSLRHLANLLEKHEKV